MKRIVTFIVLIFLAACQPTEEGVYGYVEGEFVMIAPTTSGLLRSLSVERGQMVDVGDPLFSLDLTELEAQRGSAAAEVKRAEAELRDLMTGDRPEEIDIILKQKAQAQAKLISARNEYNRVLPLSKTGAANITTLDEAKAAYDSAKASIAESDARIAAANLGARIDVIEAAEAMVGNLKQALVLAEKRITDAAPLAGTKAVVEETFFQQGEYVAAGQPVVNLLPPENVKIRFYVSQEKVAQMKPGQGITVKCSGCIEPISAKISYISSQVEYTPPVIYSVESRNKLVFLVEAKPDVVTTILRPGLPVDIVLGF